MAKTAQLKIVEKGSELEEARGRLRSGREILDRELQSRVELARNREAILLEGSDDLLDQLDGSIEAFDRKIARHRERVSLLERQISELEQAEHAEIQTAERQARYDAAKSLVSDALRFQNTEYGLHATAIAVGLDLVDQADRAAAQANEDLPAGAEPLQVPSFATHVPVSGSDIGWRPVPLSKRVGELPGVGRYDRPFWPRR